MKWCEKCKDYPICVLTDKKPKCFTDRKTETQTEIPCDNCQEWDCYGCDYKQSERSSE